MPGGRAVHCIVAAAAARPPPHWQPGGRADPTTHRLLPAGCNTAGGAYVKDPGGSKACIAVALWSSTPSDWEDFVWAWFFLQPLPQPKPFFIDYLALGVFPLGVCRGYDWDGVYTAGTMTYFNSFNEPVCIVVRDDVNEPGGCISSLLAFTDGYIECEVLLDRDLPEQFTLETTPVYKVPVGGGAVSYNTGNELFVCAGWYDDYCNIDPTPPCADYVPGYTFEGAAGCYITDDFGDGLIATTFKWLSSPVPLVSSGTTLQPLAVASQSVGSQTSSSQLKYANSATTAFNITLDPKKKDSVSTTGRHRRLRQHRRLGLH